MLKWVATVLNRWTIVFAVPAALLLASRCSALSAQVREDVFGCWARKVDAPPRTEAPKVRSVNKVILCFHPDEKLSGGYLEPTGEAGSIEGVWDLNGSGLRIGGALCVLNIESGGRQFALSGCDFAGQWSLTCRDPDGAFECPKK